MLDFLDARFGKERVMSKLSIGVVVPTLNATKDWSNFAPKLLESISPDRVLIIDSSSVDGTADLARAANFRVITIAREEFGHGRTRQLAVELLSTVDIIVFLTQDAVLESSNSICTLLQPFDDPTVVATFGRQLPREGATPIETHARLFNYPAQTSERTLASRDQLGFKVIFISNSFAAYRRDTLVTVGGFPRNVIFGEDTIVAANLLLSGWKIAYVAEARVYHSHRYSWTQDFRRYFDIGVLHAQENWLLEKFGNTGGEGSRFVRSELKYLWPRYWWLIPSAVIHTALKFVGYRLGRIENRLSSRWKRKLSMHPNFWK
jgi:rhamnosyltransferase